MEKKRERGVDEGDALKADTSESLPKASKTELENRLGTEGDEKAINSDKSENRPKEEQLDHSANGALPSPTENEKIEVLWDIKQESDDSESVLIENVWWPALVGGAATDENSKEYHELHYEEYKSFAEEQRRIRFLSPGYLLDLEENNSMKYRRPGEDWEEVYGNIALSLDDMKDLEGEDDGSSVEDYLMAAAKHLPHTQKIQLARGVQKFKSLLASKFNSFEGDVVTEDHMREWINEFLQELHKE